MMRLPGGFVRSPEPPEYSDINSYYLSNYTQIQNISFTASPNYDTHQQHNRQPRFFFPNGQIDFGKSIQSNQWTEHWSNSLPLKRDSQPAPHEPDHNQEEAPLALGVDTMISELSGKIICMIYSNYTVWCTIVKKILFWRCIISRKTQEKWLGGFFGIYILTITDF